MSRTPGVEWKPMIPIQASHLSYRVSTKIILEDLNFEIKNQSLTVVVGENGAGKSTLLKMLMGFCRPTRGSLSVLGHTPASDPSADRLSIAYLSENLCPPMDWSVAEFLKFNRWFYPQYSLNREAQLLAHLQVDPKSRIGQLSTGETRRVQVVAALSFLPRLVIIDEFTAVLDIVGRAKFMQLLKELIEEQNATVLMATNIIDDVDGYATDLLVLHEGRLVWHSSKELLKQQNTSHSTTTAIASLIQKKVSTT